MNFTFTKYELIVAFFSGSPLLTKNGTVFFQVINEVAREDGSNHCYNVSGIKAPSSPASFALKTNNFLAQNEN